MRLATPLVLLLVFLLPASARAWSYKEHIQFTRLAAHRILDDPAAPDDLKAWLRANVKLIGPMSAERDFSLHARVGTTPDPREFAGLTWWALVPDLEANDRSSKPVQPFGVRERLMHFVDLEFFAGGSDAQPKYRDDLSMLPPVDAIPRDWRDVRFAKAGLLPHAVEHAHANLVRCIRAGKLAADPADVEDQDHAVRWAGYLVHYAQDNTQPQHATEDYKSQSYFPGLREREAPNVHSEVEWRMGDDEVQKFPELRAEYWPTFEAALATVKDPSTSVDPFTATIEVSRAAYRELPLIGAAAQHAHKVATTRPTTAPAPPTTRPTPPFDTEAFFRFAKEPGGRTVAQMKAEQTALAVLRTEKVLRQAWAEAKGQP